MKAKEKSYWQNKNVFITGINGFVGGNLAKKLLDVSANVFGAGFPRNFVSSFSWGGSAGYITFRLNKVFEVAEKVMQRRAIEFNQVEKDILTEVFELTKSYRKD